MQGKVLTVASGKGGVGKTTTAVNLAVALWREGNVVALVDADLGMANVAAVLALEPATTLHDVLSGEVTLEEAIIEANDGDLLVLPGDRQLAGFADADPAELRSVLADLAGRCDYVVVDTGAGLSHEDVLPLGLADEILLVTTPEPAAVGDTRKTHQLAGLLDGPVGGIVVTRALEDTDADSIAAEVGVELLGTIPEDPAVTESTMNGGPLESNAPDAPATAAYRDLAASITGDAPPVDDAPGEEPTEEAASDGAEETDEAASDGTEEAEEAATDGTEETDETDDLRTTPGDEGGEEVEGLDESGSSPDGDAADGKEEDEAATSDESSPDDTDSSPPETDGTAAAVTATDSMEDAGEEDRGPDGDDAGGATESAEDDSEPDQEREPTRGGFFGWLGRLFS